LSIEQTAPPVMTIMSMQRSISRAVLETIATAAMVVLLLYVLLGPAT
jgi:hypothetical protein